MPLICFLYSICWSLDNVLTLISLFWFHVLKIWPYYGLLPSWHQNLLIDQPDRYPFCVSMLVPGLEIIFRLLIYNIGIKWVAAKYSRWSKMYVNFFSLSQTSLTLTKLIEKCTKIYNIKIHLKYVLIVHSFGIIDDNLFFYKLGQSRKFDVGRNYKDLSILERREYTVAIFCTLP